MRNLMVWNQVMCLKFIWRLISKAQSLWVDWHTSIHLNVNSFWEIEGSAADSWAWRKLLDLRPLALQFCKTRLGNGLTARFWYDPWTPLSQLITYIGAAGPRALRIRRTAVVADAISNAHWSLPHPRSQKEVNLHSYLTTLSLPLPVHVEDEYEWVVGNFASTDFRSAQTWEVLRPRQEAKDWFDVIWFKGAIPKHSFTMWVANYDRLPTRSRLASWGLPMSPIFPFCSTHDETRDHVLLSCDYSMDIWRAVMFKCRPPPAQLLTWAELLSWIRTSTSRRLTLLRKIAVQTTIFHLWKQRNNLIHNHIPLSAAMVFYGIDKVMKNIISARQNRKAFSSLMIMWLQ